MIEKYGSEMPEEERRHFSVHLARYYPDVAFGTMADARARSLSFFPRHRLVTIKTSADEPGLRHFLYGAGGLAEITPKLDAIYAVSAISGVEINRLTVVDYARFLFATYSRSPAHAMLIESWDAVEWGWINTPEQQQRIKGAVSSACESLAQKGVDIPAPPIGSAAYRGFTLTDDFYNVRAYMQTQSAIVLATITVAPYKTFSVTDGGRLREWRAGEVEVKDVSTLASTTLSAADHAEP
jgi:hypothetical protein